MAVRLRDAASDAVAELRSVRTDELGRRGRRSDGAAFTVETLGQYYAHDMAHHLWDVRG